MHQITGFYFLTKGPKRFVVYSTYYPAGKFQSMHDCTGLTDEQAKGKFIIEHNQEVDRLIIMQKAETTKQKIIV